MNSSLLIEVDGWVQFRTKSSHRQFHHPTKKGTVTVSGKAERGHAAGETKEEVLALVREAIEFHLEGLEQDGQPIPTPASTSALVEVKAAQIAAAPDSRLRRSRVSATLGVFRPRS